MKRIHIHWTGGTHSVNDVDRRHYHFIIDGDGNVVQGDNLPEANLDVTDGNYTAHTRAANTGAIGVAVAAMAGAVERRFDPGQYPITEAQLDALARLCADLCDGYGIPIERHTVLTHAEVQPTLGIAQRAKWDITWLPGMSGPQNPIAVGDILRDKIRSELSGPSVPVSLPVPDEVAKVIDDAAKPWWRSTSVRAQVVAILSSVWAFWQSADDFTRGAIVVGALAVLWLFRERVRKINLGGLARKALGQ